MLGHDHVDVLERRDDGQDGDRERGVARDRAQRVLARAGRRRAEPAAQHVPDDRGGDRERGERADVGARDAGAEADEGERDREPAQRLEHDAQPDRLVGAGGLQEAALQAQQQPHHAGHGDGGRGPLLLDVERRRERLAHDRGADGHDREHDQDVARPAPQRARQLAAAAEAAERALARRRDLERGAGDEQDDREVQQRRERAVAVGAQQPREDDGEDDRDEVGGHRGGREADRLRRSRGPGAVAPRSARSRSSAGSR